MTRTTGVRERDGTKPLTMLMSVMMAMFVAMYEMYDIPVLTVAKGANGGAFPTTQRDARVPTTYDDLMTTTYHDINTSTATNPVLMS